MRAREGLKPWEGQTVQETPGVPVETLPGDSYIICSGYCTNNRIEWNREGNQ